MRKMIFLEKCNKLIAEYNTDCIKQNNGTLLLGIDKIPRSRYSFYKRLEEKHIKTFLIDAYKNNVPKEYLELIGKFNGARLFTAKINYKNKFTLAHPRLVIFGIPRALPQDRINEEEPIDIRIEDLSRHIEISKKWLKIGCYEKNPLDETVYDIFIDTDEETVYTCEKNTCIIDEKWNCLDDCLCELFDRLTSKEWEFYIK